MKKYLVINEKIFDVTNVDFYLREMTTHMCNILYNTEPIDVIFDDLSASFADLTLLLEDITGNKEWRNLYAYIFNIKYKGELEISIQMEKE